MKRIRSRLTIYLYILVTLSILLSLLFSYLIRSGILMVKDSMQMLVFGFGLRDVLLLIAAILAVVASITLVSRKTTNPIRSLSAAMREVAAGNFGVQVTLKDRTEEFHELEQNFNLMARELQGNEYLKKDFVSGVSHEFKTPLSVIGGYAKLLRDDEGTLTEGEKKEYLSLIVSETERLTELTSNMLRLSRMDSEQIRPKSEAFSLDEQLRQAILLLEPKWSAKGLEVDVELEELQYTGDAELLMQVWTNLIGNAVKYTEQGTITLRAEETEGDITVSVADTGCGMSPEVLQRAFDRFYQGDSSRKKEGSGLGLAIVRRIVELHGGTVSAESAAGEGSTFRVFLPVKSVSAEEEKPRSRHKNAI